MTTDDPRKVRAIIENVNPHKGDKRVFVTASFPLGGNGHLLLMLAEQMGNPIELMFSEPLQLSLNDLKPGETETVNTTVDGQPAKITRTKVTNETRALLEAMQEAGRTNHVFVSRTEDEFCENCGQPAESGVHVVPTWTERYNFHLSAPDTSSFEHPANAADAATDDVSNGFAQQLTEDEAAFRESLFEGEGSELSPTAKALIDSASQTPTLVGQD